MTVLFGLLVAGIGGIGAGALGMYIYHDRVVKTMQAAQGLSKAVQGK